MLSGETAVGSYPVESVKYMDEIVRNAENHIDSWSICPTLPEEADGDDAMSICRAAKELAHDRNVACIAVFSLTGRTALLMSKVRPRVSIHVFTPNLDTYTRLSLYWGIIPHHVPFASSVEQMISVVDISLQSATTYERGQQVDIVSGLPVDAMKAPNMALLHTIGSRH
jgi:pyruvate kinase